MNENKNTMYQTQKKLHISYTKIKKREKKQFTQKYEENIKKLKFRFRIILPDITRVTRAVYFFDYMK